MQNGLGDGGEVEGGVGEGLRGVGVRDQRGEEVWGEGRGVGSRNRQGGEEGRGAGKREGGDGGRIGTVAQEFQNSFSRHGFWALVGSQPGT